MLVDWLVVAAIALGHVALFVLMLNVLHAQGIAERPLGFLNGAWLGLLLAGLGGIGWLGPWAGWPEAAKGYGWLCLAMTCVALPSATIGRAFRKVPAGTSTRHEDRDLGAELGVENLAGQGFMLRLPGNESLRIRKVEANVALANLPPSLDGLTLVQVSDLHFSPRYRRAYFEAVLDEVARWEADLVLFTGDLLDCESTVEWVEPLLSGLRGRLGQYAILGNHDHQLRPGKARRALRKAGFVDLEGRWETVEIDGATLALGGTSEPWGSRIDYDAMPPADFRILMSHCPDQFPRASARGVELILAGHNHGGQIRLPVIGPILMPSRYSRRFDRGFFRGGSTLMYVSQGIGGKHPIRYGGCSPEVARLTLQAAPARLPHGRETVDARVARRP